MKWWKRLIFSLISLVMGFASFDYLIYAFRLLVDDKNQTGQYHWREDGLPQLCGALLFAIWFVVLFFYYILLRKSSNQIDLIVKNKKTGEERIRRKWFDVLLQLALFLTGACLRWCYLMLIYFPSH